GRRQAAWGGRARRSRAAGSGGTRASFRLPMVVQHGFGEVAVGPCPGRGGRVLKDGLTLQRALGEPDAGIDADLVDLVAVVLADQLEDLLAVQRARLVE